MVNKCCVPLCRGNYKSGETVHVFSFPLEKERRASWLKAIRRKDFKVTKHSFVCHKHFMSEDVLWETKAIDPKTGKLLTAPLFRPRLREDAIPRIFPVCPSILFSKLEEVGYTKKEAEELEEKKISLEFPAIEDDVNENFQTHKERIYTTTLPTLNDLKWKLCDMKFPEGWTTIFKDTSLIFLYMDVNIEPHRICYLVLKEDLSAQIFNNKGVSDDIDFGRIDLSRIFSIQDLESVLMQVDRILNSSKSQPY